MDAEVRRGPKLAALAVLAVLTAALLQSVALQRVNASQLAPAEARLRQSCHERLHRAIEAARAAGDVELADWIESLPVYHNDIPSDAPARPAAP
jgi:hypothetical protein